MQFNSKQKCAFARGMVLGALCLLALSTLGLCGCTTSFPEWVHNGFKVGPNYRKPPAYVASEWIDSGKRKINQDAPPLADWWEVFQDPVLNGLIHQAYPRNLSLRAAGFRVLQARAQLAIAVGEVFPQSQTFNGSYTRSKVSESRGGSGGNVLGNGGTGSGAVSGTGGSGVGTGTGIVTGSGGGGSGSFLNSWATSLNLSWELDFWGRFRRAVESADATLDASVEDYDEALVILLSDVATAYVQYRTLQKRLILAKANIKEQEQSVKVAKDQYDIKKIVTGYFQLKSNLKQTESLVPQLEISLRLANNQLCTLLGMTPRDLSAVLGDGLVSNPSDPTKKTVLIPQPKVKEVAVGIPGQLLLRRPDVQKAERLVKAQSAQIGIAESDLYPHIAINGSLGLSADSFSRLFNAKSWTGNIGPSLTWNILNYGRILANVRLQDARFQELVVLYQNTLLNANQEAENALISYLNGLDRAEFLNDSAVAAEEEARILIAQVAGGKLDATQIFTVQNFKTQQQDAAAQAQGDVTLNLILLYRSLGGGWQIRLKDATKKGQCVLPPVGEEIPLIAPQPLPISVSPSSGQSAVLNPNQENSPAMLGEPLKVNSLPDSSK